MKKPSVGDARNEVAGARKQQPRRLPDVAAGIFAPEIAQEFADIREAAGKKGTKGVRGKGDVVSVPYPFPSPTDWRDCWMYFLILDRFANDRFPPSSPWNQRFDYRQG